MKPIAIIAIIAAVIVVGGACAGVAFSGVLNGGTTGPGGDDPVVPTDPVEPTPTETPTETPTPTETQMSTFAPMTSSGSSSSGSGSNSGSSSTPVVTDPCPECGEGDWEYEPHTVTPEMHNKTCVNCSYIIEKECEFAADFVYTGNDVSTHEHSLVCTLCGSKKDTAACIFTGSYATDGVGTNTHSDTCAICDYKDTQPCTMTYAYQQSGDSHTHWKQCGVCSVKDTLTTTTLNYLSDGEGSKTHSRNCDTCGYTETADCNFGTAIHHEAGNNAAHYQTCSTCGQKYESAATYTEEPEGTYTCTCGHSFTITSTLEEPVVATVISGSDITEYANMEYAVSNATGDNKVLMLLADMTTPQTISTGTKVVINPNGKDALFNYEKAADIQILAGSVNNVLDILGTGSVINVTGGQSGAGELTVTFNSTKTTADGFLVVDYAKDATNQYMDIYSAAGLFKFASFVNDDQVKFTDATVTMMADVDLENAAWEPIGQTGDTMFEGVFDGNEKTISNLNVDRSAIIGNVYDAAGFFGWIETHSTPATIKGLTIKKATIYGNYFAGGIIGYSHSSVGENTIQNCHVVDATITGCMYDGTDGTQVGGIVGSLWKSKMTGCSVMNADLYSFGSGQYDTVSELAGWTGTDATVDDTNTHSNVNVYEETLAISTTDELFAFATSVNDGTTTYSGKTILLMNDIDLNYVPWTPIGNVNGYPTITFAGTFNGQEHTISNMIVKDDDKNYACSGFFGSTTGNVLNLNIDNANIKSTHYAGGIVGYFSDKSMKIENCKVTNSEITAALEKQSDGSYDNGDKAGGIIGYMAANGVVTGCTVENTKITGYRDIGGIVGYAAGTVEKNTVTNVELTIDKSQNYKGYTTDDEYDAGAIIGDSDSAIETDNTATGVIINI